MAAREVTLQTIDVLRIFLRVKGFRNEMSMVGSFHSGTKMMVSCVVLGSQKRTRTALKTTCSLRPLYLERLIPVGVALVYAALSGAQAIGKRTYTLNHSFCGHMLCHNGLNQCL